MYRMLIVFIQCYEHDKAFHTRSLVVILTNSPVRVGHCYHLHIADGELRVRGRKWLAEKSPAEFMVKVRI